MLAYETVSFCGVTSPSTPEIVTLSLIWCIPWFLWLTRIWRPSLTVVIPLVGIEAPVSPPAPVIALVTPATAPANSKFPEPTANSPWTLSNINSLVLPMDATVNLALIPKLVVIPKTSPTVYPSPPFVMVADTTDPTL